MVTEKGTAVLFLTHFEDKGRAGNSIMRSYDHGAAWSGPEPFVKDSVFYPCAVAVAGGTNYVLLDCAGSGSHELYASTDDGQTWSRRSVLPLQKDAWYGALCVMEGGRLLAGAYVTEDEDHLYYCISADGGCSWACSKRRMLIKKFVIRNLPALMVDTISTAGRRCRVSMFCTSPATESTGIRV